VTKLAPDTPATRSAQVVIVGGTPRASSNLSVASTCKKSHFPARSCPFCLSGQGYFFDGTIVINVRRKSRRPTKTKPFAGCYRTQAISYWSVTNGIMLDSFLLSVAESGSPNPGSASLQRGGGSTTRVHASKPATAPTWFKKVETMAEPLGRLRAPAYGCHFLTSVCRR
jgi:hypothetical protein